jgi:hypothetical protein
VASIPNDNYARLYRDGDTAVLYGTTTAYAQDLVALSRLTMTGGVRWERQDDRALPTSVPANPIEPVLLPAATFAGAAPPARFRDLAPRASASLDLFGHGRTIVSGSAGVYFEQGINLARALSLTGTVTAFANWNDLNRDQVVQPNELSAVEVVSDYDVTTGLQYGPNNTIDPALEAPRVREGVVSLDQAVGHETTISVGYVARAYDRFLWSYVPGAPATFTANRAVGYGGVTAIYYTPLLAGDATETTNEPGRHLDYGGVDIGATTRWNGRWMVSGAVTFQRSVDHFPPGSYQNPTNIADLDGHAGDVSLPRYVAKIAGRVRLPWQIGASVSANLQDGLIRDLVINNQPGLTFGQSSGAATVGSTSTLLIAPQGSTRYPKVAVVDLQVDKSLALGSRVRVVFSAVVFNLFNAGTVLSEVSNLSLTTDGSVLNLLGPRVARLGARVEF